SRRNITCFDPQDVVGFRAYRRNSVFRSRGKDARPHLDREMRSGVDFEAELTSPADPEDTCRQSRDYAFAHGHKGKALWRDVEIRRECRQYVACVRTADRGVGPGARDGDERHIEIWTMYIEDHLYVLMHTVGGAGRRVEKPCRIVDAECDAIVQDEA